MVDDKPPPPSPAADTGSGGVAQGFTVNSGQNDDDHPHGEPNMAEVGIEGTADPTYAGGASRSGAADKYARPNDNPHLAYIYRARGNAAQDESGGFSSGGGGDGKVTVGDDKAQDQVSAREVKGWMKGEV